MLFCAVALGACGGGDEDQFYNVSGSWTLQVSSDCGSHRITLEVWSVEDESAGFPLIEAEVEEEGYLVTAALVIGGDVGPDSEAWIQVDGLFDASLDLYLADDLDTSMARFEINGSDCSDEGRAVVVDRERE
jgi:hypothetical protein